MEHCINALTLLSNDSIVFWKETISPLSLPERKKMAECIMMRMLRENQYHIPKEYGPLIHTIMTDLPKESQARVALLVLRQPEKWGEELLNAAIPWETWKKIGKEAIHTTFSISSHVGTESLKTIINDLVTGLYRVYQQYSSEKQEQLLQDWNEHPRFAELHSQWIAEDIWVQQQHLNTQTEPNMEKPQKRRGKRL